MNDRTCGTNILYCENPNDTTILSRVFKNGVDLYSDSPDYDTEKLMLSSNPVLDSIKIAKESHFSNHYVSLVVSTDLKQYRTKAIKVCLTGLLNLNYQHKLIMARHEGVNKRVKDLRCMSSIWRHSWKAHVPTFYAIIALT